MNRSESREELESRPRDNGIRVASFDIGKVNFSFCVEEYDPNDLKDLILPSKKRYLASGEPTEELEKILTQVYASGRILEWQNVDLTGTTGKNAVSRGAPSILFEKLRAEVAHHFTLYPCAQTRKKMNGVLNRVEREYRTSEPRGSQESRPERKEEIKTRESPSEGLRLEAGVYYNLVEYLDQFKSLWDVVDVILIEEQMSYGKGKTNPMALKLSHHCRSYFVMRYPRVTGENPGFGFKFPLEFHSKYKTHILGANRKETKAKTGRKNWTVNKTTQILFGRDEDPRLYSFLGHSKKDDLADTFCMIQAYKFMRANGMRI